MSCTRHRFVSTFLQPGTRSHRSQHLLACWLCVAAACAAFNGCSGIDGPPRREGNEAEGGAPSGSGGANNGAAVDAGLDGQEQDGGEPNSSGTAGSATVGGASPGAGGASSGAMAGGAGPATPDCAFTVRSEISPVIATVGIIEWNSGLEEIDSARIEFGVDSNYGMTAPVDLAEPSYRTLLLGMKPSRTYHFRIVAQSSTAECTSDDFTLTTGPRPNGLPELSATDFHPERLAGGFLITGLHVGGIDSRPPAYILDADGEMVWWYPSERGVSGASMSYDGKYMWINDTNAPENPTIVHRVSMDGLVDEDHSAEFEGQNHQLAVLPDETVAFYAYGENGCEDIKLRRPDGSVRTLTNAHAVHAAGSLCHVNMIQYSPFDETLVFSDLYHLSYAKITLEGQLVWVLGGGPSNHFRGDGAVWENQHGIHVLGIDRYLMFNNGPPGGESLAIEILLDIGARTASRVWTYAAVPSIYNPIMGDVQRLANGNTIIAYSVKGVLHEVGPDGTLLRELSWALGGNFGYVTHRDSLYGPPTR